MLNDFAYFQAANCLKMLAQPLRLKMVDLLLAGPKSVGELSDLCQIKQNLASEHLKLLRLCGFVETRKAGRTVIYHIAESHLQDILNCVYRKFGAENGNKSRRTKGKIS